MEEIGKFLKIKRAEKDYSLKELATLCNTTDATLSRIENGKVEPDFTLLLALSKHLNFSLEELTGDIKKTAHGNSDIEQIIEKTVEKTLESEIALKHFRRHFTDYRDKLVKNIVDLHHDIPDSIPVKITNKTIKYPILSDKLACGLSLIPAEDEVDDWIELPETYNVNAEIVLRAKGDCLDNEKIHDGYLVFIRVQNTASSGDIVAVRVIENSHGHAILKKLKILKDNMFLTDKTGEIIEFKENMSIVGKAVYWMPDPEKFK